MNSLTVKCGAPRPFIKQRMVRVDEMKDQINCTGSIILFNIKLTSMSLSVSEETLAHNMSASPKLTGSIDRLILD